MRNVKKTFQLLPKNRAAQVPLIIFGMIIGAGFEVLSIGMIIPIVNIVAGNTENSILVSIPYLNHIKKEYFFELFLISFSIIYLIKGLYLSALAYFFGKYIYKVKAEITDQIMLGYIKANYEFHISRNSSVLIRNLTAEVAGFVGYALTPLLVIASEGFVVIFIALFLLLIEPIGTILVIMGLIFLAISFQKALAGFSKKLGLIRQKADGLLLKSAQETLGGIRDVKLLGKEELFAKKFLHYNSQTSEVSGKQYFVSQLPRLYLETIGVFVMLFLLYILSMRSDDINQFIPVAAAFGFAAFRLLPSVNRLLGSFNSLQFGEPIIDTLSQEVKHFYSKTNTYKEEQRPEKGFVFEHSIELIGVSYKYPGSTDNSINNISLKIMKGESVGFIGKSGAGKSTLIEIVLGLLVPDSGKIYIDGKDIQNQLNAWHNQIGYVQQDIFLLDDSILSNIIFGDDDSEVNIKKITEAIKSAQLSEFVASLPEGLNTKLGERGVRLSGGQKQRIGIARALYRNCSILIFDEATSSLDNETEAEIVSTIKNLKKEKTVIIIAHRLSTIEYCDRVIELNNGYLHR